MDQLYLIRPVTFNEYKVLCKYYDFLSVVQTIWYIFLNNILFC